MALDGITVANIVKELRDQITGARIAKIGQPEADELLLTLKSPAGQKRLVLSASASLPLIYLTEKNKVSPMVAPNFCMLLRKHIGNGRIVSVSQPSLERIIRFEIEHYDEMGDLRHKVLILELMGKHSNLIFTDENSMIIDSIKHISAQTSSVREVLPGREYFIPRTQEKLDPLSVDEASFSAAVFTKPMPLTRAIYSSLTGISPVIAEELCFRSSLESGMSAKEISEAGRLHLFSHFERLMEDVKAGQFQPNIVYDASGIPTEFASVPLTMYADLTSRSFDSVSALLETYYAEKNAATRIRQKSSDLRRVVSTVLEREAKKLDLQTRQLKDTDKREKYRVYGELLHTYGYSAEPGAKSVTVPNYYDGDKEIKIPLDPDKSAADNAKRYFEKYDKLKRTYEALSELILDTRSSVEQLESIKIFLEHAQSEADLQQIRQELVESDYIKRKGSDQLRKGSRPGKQGKQKGLSRPEKSKPLHYRTRDGFDIYVGKNNLQNDYLTFKFASGGDFWFHAKKAPGSHVIVKSQGLDELPDSVYESAASVAAYYSKNRSADKVEIDYVKRKEVKKPNGSKPGFVVYYTNYSMIARPDISQVELIDD